MAGMRQRWARWAVNVCRAVLAATFVFSGFTKAVDPIGTQYKIRDYLAAWQMAGIVPDALTLAASVAMSAAEFTLGVCLLFAMHRRAVSRIALAAMAVLTPLTLWLAVDEPISDCGCFGDAVKLSNWETLWKNVALLACAAVVARWPMQMTRFVSRTTQWIVINYTALYSLVVSGMGLYYLPLFDFRPYHVGADIRAGMEIPPGAPLPQYETTFILEKDGVRREFTLDDYPDSTWTFINSNTVQTAEGYVPPIHDFSMTRRDNGEDITEQALANPGYSFLLVAPYLEQADDSRFDLINEIYEYAVEYGYPFYCLTASADRAIATWRDLTGAEYPFCATDATTLQTIIRSNPGLVLIKDGKVVRKWSRNDLPGEADLSGPLDKIEAGQTPRNSMAAGMAKIVAWFVLPLLLLTLTDRLWAWSRYIRRVRPVRRRHKGTGNKQQDIQTHKTKENEKENRGRQLEDEHEPARRTGPGKGA